MLFEIEPLKNYLNLNQKVSKIISILNVRDVKDNFPASFRLLSSPSFEESKKILVKLLEKSELRRGKIEIIIEEIEKRIFKKITTALMCFSLLLKICFPLYSKIFFR